MRVLWLTPIQLPAAKRSDPTAGGWMEGLRQALQDHEPDVELTIVSLGRIRHEPFREGNAEYLRVSSAEPVGRLAELRGRWCARSTQWGAVEECQRIIARKEPDVVHVHGTDSFLGLALEGTRVPAVISLQGIMHSYMKYVGAGLEPADWLRLSMTRQSMHGYGLLHTLRSYRSRARTELRIVTLCDAYMGRTEWDRAVLKAVRPDARYYHDDRILRQVFYSQVWRDPGPEAPIFCTAGTSPLKGLETLLDAVIVLRGALGRPVRLRVAGAVRGSDLWPMVRRRLDDPRLRSSVDLLGVLDAPAIARELQRSSLYVLPSHIDNNANALCEAMLAGLPCVATFVGGIPSLIKHAETGLLCQGGEPAMLAEAIDRLLTDRGMAGSLGKAARDIALARHDPERIAHGVVDVYRDVIRNAAASDK
jgi:glycosyltransferase involved in cell wall biosynthesis